MSEQIKYEAVFGDQALFDDADPDVVLAETNGVYRTFHKESDSRPYNIASVSRSDLAMRRIIRTPTWTVADQKAGKLPEVGVTVIAIEYEEECKVAAINNDAVCVVFDDGEFITLHVSGISPIEKPEERAKREEDEFVDSNIVGVEFKDNYELSFYRKGLRAAYRKLKMSEVQK